MSPEQVLILIQSGESQTVEFKTAVNAVPKSVYETVCAFSKRDGGDILLGVKDNGAIVGIERACIGQIGKDFVTDINNENKMSPALYLIPEEVELDGRYLLHIHVPKHSQVCRCKGRIYDRNGDADIEKTDEGGLKTDEGGLKTVTSKTADTIIKLMQNNPNTTVSDIVNHLCIARPAVTKHIKGRIRIAHENACRRGNAHGKECKSTSIFK